MMEKQKRKNDALPPAKPRWKSYLFGLVVGIEVTAIVVIGLLSLYIEAAALYIFRTIVTRCTFGIQG